MSNSMTSTMIRLGLAASLALGLLLTSTPRAAVGQFPSPLPVLPQQNPRPIEGQGEGEKWNTARPDGDNAPTASYLDSLKSNDAALEVILGQARLLTLKKPITSKEGDAVIAVADPNIIDFEVLPNPRMIRITGQKAGVTDLSITAADGTTFSFEIRVVYNLTLLEAQLMQVFPDARIKLGQVSNRVVVEGQARNAAQVAQIMRTLTGYLGSEQQNAPGSPSGGGGGGPNSPPPAPGQAPNGGGGNGNQPNNPRPNNDPGAGGSTGDHTVPIINLLRVPGGKQVMLQVRIAELNRTGLREIGADMVATPGSGVIGTNIGGAAISAAGLFSPTGNSGAVQSLSTASTTAFGLFPAGDFEIYLRALRHNSLLSILAEPNLVAMSGHEAKFLAGGEFPIPVPQTSSGVSTTNTIEFKDFGVQVVFLPFVVDEDVIRLSVTPEVSSIDFALGTITNGNLVPGLNTRRATTTVEMKQGQTLAIAGLLQVTLDSHTARIPGLGDLPYIGPFFSNTTHKRIEKELVVLVTPHIVAPMRCDEVPGLPTDGVNDPTDWEFYLLNRIEGRTGRPFRSTTAWDDPQVYLMYLDKRACCGPVGYSD